jgi:3-isopropylmalate dehydrogenase
VKLDLVTLPGDGVGPEVVRAAMDVLQAVTDRCGHTVEVVECPIGWSAVLERGDPLPRETVDVCMAAEAVLLGAVGNPAADKEPAGRRPEAGLLRLRRELGCYANLRPARVTLSLQDVSPLRPEIVQGTDLVIVRELAGGIYYGEATPEDGTALTRAYNTMAYTADEIERIARVAFELAQDRRGEVTSVDKANVLVVSRLWRRVVDEIAQDYPSVRCRHMLVDRAAMELVFNPSSFDVILTANMFGDILSDQAASLAGSIGLLASASVGGHAGLYEPVHGSAPDIAGQDIANPVGAIMSVALMLRHAFHLHEEARLIEDGVETALAQGLRTKDLAPSGSGWIGTRAMSEAIASIVAGKESDVPCTR